MGPKGLRPIRKEKKLTLAKLAAMTGVPPSTIGSYETGRVRLGPERIAKLAEALGVPITELTPTPVPVPARRADVGATRHLINRTLARRPIAYAEMLADLLRMIPRPDLEKYIEEAKEAPLYGLLAVLAAELEGRGEEPEREP